MIDTHAHLDLCDDPAEELVERARAAGVTRIVTVGTGLDSGRTALEQAGRLDGVYAAVGVHPNRAGEGDRVEDLRALLAHPRAVAMRPISRAM